MRSAIPQPRRFDWVSFLAFMAGIGVLLLAYYTPFLAGFATPFNLLATTIHELGHGFAALLVGGEFLRFQVFENAAGLATTRTPDAFKPIMAAAGLFLPPLAGAVMLALTAKFALHRTTLVVMALILGTATVTKFDGPLDHALLYGAAAFFFLAAHSPRPVRAFIAQITALRLCLQSVLSYRYAVSEDAFVGGEHYTSDTGVIAEHLGGAAWMYGIAITAFSLLLVVLVVIWAFYGRTSRPPRPKLQLSTP